MIKVRMKTDGSGVSTFLCPRCNREDVAYMSMPKECYTCGFKYDFFVDRLIKYLSERKYHHFKIRNKSILGKGVTL